MGFQRFTKKNIIANILIVIAYIIWTNIIGGLRNEHYFLIILWLVSFYAHDKSRRFIKAFSLFIMYWIIYDSMRIIPNYEVSLVNIQEPYDIEKALFGILENNVLITPNEYFAIYHTRFLDVLSGLFYINWVPIPLAFAAYLYAKNMRLFMEFSMVFLLVNIVGFAFYYIYPAAPPWYVELYGFDLHIGVPGNRAGLIRFDEIIGVPVFENIYNKNANVLAAMPSLHSSYPVIVLYYGLKMRFKWMNWFFGIFMLGIWFSAVYSNHHYIIDVIAGALIAIIILLLFSAFLRKPFIDSKMKKIIASI